MNAVKRWASEACIGRDTDAQMRRRRMKTVLAAMVITAALPIGTSIAWAKSPCAHVGPTRDAICVCNQRYCWVEPGTQYRFDARFGEARALTASGALGLWQRVRIPRTTGASHWP